MKIACVGPLRPMKTGVADFSENLLPYLAEHADISLFTDASPHSSTPIMSRFPIGDISDFLEAPSAFDAVLYHMGNHYRYHRRVYEALLKAPGVVLLHDCVLNQFFSKYALERGNFGAFARMVRLCHPDADTAMLRSFFKAKGDPHIFPLGGMAAMCSRGTIVMNEYGRGLILREAPRARTRRINFPYLEREVEADAAQVFGRKFSIPDDCIVISSIGHMTRAKKLDAALAAFQRFQARYPKSLFLLAGERSLSFPFEDVIERESFENVRYLGYLPRSDLDGLMERTDICINLRYPSNGEMSSTLIDMFGRGKAVIVSN